MQRDHEWDPEVPLPPVRSPLRAAIVLGLVALGLFLGAWWWLHSLGAAVCDDHNFVSNDFCRHNPPPEDALPIPSGWSVARHELSCGNRGCPDRVFVVRPEEQLPDPTKAYVTYLKILGWHVGRGANRNHYYFIGRKGDLVLSAQAAIGALTAVPDQFRGGDHVEVSMSLVDEAGASYQ